MNKRFFKRHAFVFVLLAIAFFDEFVYGARESAWPLIRDDLGLTYAEIGLLLGLPTFIGNFIDPFVGILADTGQRWRIILIGGLTYGLSLFLLASSMNGLMFLIASTLTGQASGAFIGPAQASLMDYNPLRREQNMARWALAGSLAIVIAPIFLGLLDASGLGWRGFFIMAAFLGLLLTLAFKRLPPHPALKNHSPDEKTTTSPLSFREGFRQALQALQRREVIRWLVLLEFSDLLLDVLLAYLALYFVDVLGLTQLEAGIAVAIWTGVGLIGDIALLPLLERITGLTYLRVSVLFELILYPAFLLVDNIYLKVTILGLIGFFNAGWYAILKGQLYHAMPHQSATVMTIGTVSGFFGSFIPALIGILAMHFGLQNAMWAILLGPIALWIGLPRKMHDVPLDDED